MALNKAQLKTDIENLLTDLYNNPGNLTTAGARTEFATKLSDAIDAFVKSGDGKYQGGMVAGSTAVTAPGNPTVIKLT